MAGSSHSAGSAAWRTGGSVLIVDDEEPVRGVLRCILEDGGFSVLTAADGSEAIETCRRYAGQLRGVLFDLTVPGPPAGDTLRAFNEIDPEVPVVVASGLSEADARNYCEALRCAAYLRKPFGPQLLLETLRDLMEKP